jgi:hypothetical protein
MTMTADFFPRFTLHAFNNVITPDFVGYKCNSYRSCLLLGRVNFCIYTRDSACRYQRVE